MTYSSIKACIKVYIIIFVKSSFSAKYNVRTNSVFLEIHPISFIVLKIKSYMVVFTFSFYFRIDNETGRIQRNTLCHFSQMFELSMVQTEKVIINVLCTLNLLRFPYTTIKSKNRTGNRVMLNI